MTSDLTLYSVVDTPVKVNFGRLSAGRHVLLNCLKTLATRAASVLLVAREALQSPVASVSCSIMTQENIHEFTQYP